MANTGFKGVDVRQTGNQLVFRASLKDSGGTRIIAGTTSLYLYEIQSDGTLKSYDFNDNTFKTTALTTETASMTHRTGNNGTTNTGIWTSSLATLTGFTVGSVYIAVVANTNASPPQQEREFQFGSAEGDLKTTANGTGVAYVQADPAPIWQDSTAGDFTVASSIGKSLYTSGVVPGGSGGLLISGSNAGTTTFNALTVTNATTLSGAVSFGSTWTVTGLITLHQFNVTGFQIGSNGLNIQAPLTLTSDGTNPALKILGGATQPAIYCQGNIGAQFIGTNGAGATFQGSNASGGTVTSANQNSDIVLQGDGCINCEAGGPPFDGAGGFNGDIGSRVLGAPTVNNVNGPITGVGVEADLNKAAIPTLSGPATTLKQMIVQTWRRFFKKTTKNASSDGKIKTYADDNTTVLTSQTYTDSTAQEVDSA